MARKEKDMALTVETRSIRDGDYKTVSSNYFSKECEQETDKWLEQGFWVGFIANCIGHTRAAMFENDGERYVRNKYGDGNIQAAHETEYGTVYYRLR